MIEWHFSKQNCRVEKALKIIIPKQKCLRTLWWWKYNIGYVFKGRIQYS